MNNNDPEIDASGTPNNNFDQAVIYFNTFFPLQN